MQFPVVQAKTALVQAKTAKPSILIPYKDHLTGCRNAWPLLETKTLGTRLSCGHLVTDTGSGAVRGSEEKYGRDAGAVLRIAEPFKYSRINNIDRREAKRDVLLFINNDLFVNEPGWLRGMLDRGDGRWRVGYRGRKIVFIPDSIAEHPESVSRDNDFDHARLARVMFENQVVRQCYQALLPKDLYYNRNFSGSGVYRKLRLMQPAEEWRTNNSLIYLAPKTYIDFEL